MKIFLSAFLTLTFVLILSNSFAQTKLSLDKLIDQKDPAWPIVKKWIDSALNKVEILPKDTLRANKALFDSQLSTYSTLGSIIYNTGGILVDNGWIRILGSGHEKLNRSVAEWNKDKTVNGNGDSPPYTLIADDAVGGFFAINLGGLGKDIKNVYYLEPNTLTWQPLGAGYGEFILFCFDSDLSKFYKGLRWSTWDQFISNLDGNKSYSFRPYLWETGTDIEKTTRKIVSVEELFKFNITKAEELKMKL